MSRRRLKTSTAAIALLAASMSAAAFALPAEIDTTAPIQVTRPNYIDWGRKEQNEPAPQEREILLAQNATVIPIEPRTLPEQQSPQDIEIVVPLNENGRYLGDIVAFISGDTPFIRLNEVARLIEPLAAPSTVERLIAADPGVAVSLDALLSEGIRASWDPGQLEINILLPVGDRDTRQIEIAQLDRTERGLFAKPAKFSTFLNLRTATDYIHDGFSDTGLQSPYVNGVWAGRAFGLAYETSFDYDTNGSGFRRNGTRFIYDDENRAVRAEFGDIVANTRSFQSSPRMAGATVYKATNTLQPYTNTRPRGFQSFSIEETSEVQVVINGRQVRRLTLAAGNYDLTNFPFVDGENNVQFIIEDRTGNRDLIEFDTFFDRSIFRPGYSEWSAALGVRSQTGLRGPTYSEDEYVATGFYRRGFENGLTAGVNAQFDESSALIGGEVLKATSVGILSGDLAVSSQENYGEGYALDVDFTRTPSYAPDEDRVNWGVSGRVTSEKFSPVGQPRFNSNAYEARLFYSRAFTEHGSSLSANLSHMWSRGSADNQWLARVSYGQRLTKTVALSTDLSWQNDRFGDDLGLRVQLTYRPGLKSTAISSYDSRTERLAASYQHRGHNALGAWSGGVDVDRTPQTSNISGSAFLLSSRGDFSVNHRASMDGDLSGTTSQVTSVRTATGIGFADGAFAIGRPVSGAFAIVNSHKTLKDSRVGVKSGATQGSLMESNWLGKPLVSDLPTYSKRNIEYDVEDLPLGYDLGSGSVDVRAPFYAGYKLTVGSALNTTMIATALDEFGEPIAFIAGVVTSPDYPDLEPIDMFTNKTGRFGIPGLGPGDWELRLSTEPQATIIRFTIEEDASALVRMGELRGEFK